MASLRLATGFESDKLKSALDEMSKYGRVILGQYGNDGRWHCQVKLNVVIDGSSFEVKTPYGEGSPKCPLKAALMCHGLLVTALESVREELRRLDSL